MPISTVPAPSPLVIAPIDQVLPRCLAYTPEHVRRLDGSYLTHGLRTGDRQSCRSVLELAVLLQLESCMGLRKVTFLSADTAADSHLIDHPLGLHDGPLVPRLAPTMMVEVEIGNRRLHQVVSVCRSEVAGSLVDAEEGDLVRRAWRERGVTWGLMTEASIDWGRLGTLLFLSECAGNRMKERGEAHVLRAVATATSGDTVRDILVEASLAGDFLPGVAMRALGRLIANGEVEVDLSKGPIRTDRALGRRAPSSDAVEDEIAIADGWRQAFAAEAYIESVA